MNDKVHPTGGFRAYKKIGGVEHQHYSRDVNEHRRQQAELERRADLHHRLAMPRLFAKCGRLIGLRVTPYKKTHRPTFLLQVSVNGKQQKTQRFITRFEDTWRDFYTLWREHYGISVIDARDLSEAIKAAKRLYRQDVSALETTQTKKCGDQ